LSSGFFLDEPTAYDPGMRVVGWVALIVWVACIVYWATLADCLEAAACSDAHLWLNGAAFAGIFVIPAGAGLLALAGLLRGLRRG
jgi:hypothetical protein